MMSFKSHDEKFLITFHHEDESDVKHLSFEAKEEVSVCNLAHAIFIDCFCNREIDSPKVHCKVKTPSKDFEFTIPTCQSFDETLFQISDHIMF